MADGPKRRISSDTQPITIPPDVLARFRRDSERPMATDDDVRRALADTVPDAVQCPGCLGLGKTSASRALVLVDALAAAAAITTGPIALRQAPPPAFEDDDDEPTTR